VYPDLPLRSTVEILLDRWGIPHIYAGCAEDVFFAQGFNAARDRLWQIDLWRRQGLGLLSEVLGADYIARDRAARLFLYRGAMEQEWAAYGCDLRPVIEPFVAGINEYIRLIGRQPDLLPVEFRLLDYLPAPWEPDDVLRIRAHGRYRNVSSEVQRACILRDFGPEAEAMRVLLEPDVDLTVPPGLDLALITPEVLRDYELAPTSFGVFSRGLEPAMDGSNNWAISGRRTASGRPILANDPHRAVEVPSLRYLAHIVCPGLDIIGGGEPALPGISIGHNGQVAFGLTVLPVDQEDLYVYETDGPGGSCYRYREGWEAMEIVSETIPVRGGKSVDVALKFTRHGPVVAELPAKCAAFSVRAAWLQPGMAPYVAGIGLMQAHDLDEFRTAARGWGAPGENLLYADVKNNIAWQPAALVPVRPNWDGLLPVPGDGRYEWAGFITTADLPVEVNPARGWLATANQRNIDPDQIGGVRVGFEWEPPFRFQRIQDVLEQDRLLTVEESAALQNDYLSLAARHLHKTLASLQCTDERAARGAAMLAEWDLHLEARSAAAALFEVWFRSHLRPALFAEVLAEQVPAGKLGRALESLVNHANVTGDARIDLALIDHVESSPRTARQLDRIFESTLAAAMRHLEDLLGPDSTVWQWGALHQVKIEHPLTHELNAVTDLNRHGAQPRGGCGDTVGNTSYGTASFAQTWGATLRMVLDVGEWDNSLAMNSPGQSGDPRSRHYADLITAWARDESIPLLYSRQHIEGATEHRIVLTSESGEHFETLPLAPCLLPEISLALLMASVNMGDACRPMPVTAAASYGRHGAGHRAFIAESAR
jgi:penicillin amidase